MMRLLLSLLVLLSIVKSLDLTEVCNVSPAAMYDATSFDDVNYVWTDLSGNGNDVTAQNIVNGDAITKGAFKRGQSFIAGPTTSSITFPVSLEDDYTFFYVSSYQPDAASARGRIFDAVSEAVDWYGGHWAGYAGVATHGGIWFRHYEAEPVLSPTDWIFGAEQRLFYHPTGYNDDTDAFTTVDAVTSANEEYTGPRGQIAINAGRFSVNYDDESDFQVAELIMFTSEIAAAEIACVEEYLLMKYTVRFCDALDVDSFLESCSPNFDDITTTVASNAAMLESVVPQLSALESEVNFLKMSLNMNAAKAQSDAMISADETTAISSSNLQAFLTVFLVVTNFAFLLLILCLFKRVGRLTSGRELKYLRTAIDSEASDSDC